MKIVSDIKKNFGIVKYVVKFCPLYVLFTFIYIICNTIMSLSKVYLIERLVSTIERLIIDNNTSYDDIIVYIAIYLGVIIICSIYNSIYNSYIKGYFRIIYIKRIRTMMFKKAKEVDFESFDNPDFYDIYSRAMRDGVFRGITVYEDITVFISSLVNVLTLGTFIVVSNPILIAIVFASVILMVIIRQRVNTNIFNFDKICEPDIRMYGYVKRVFYQQRFAAEIKSTSISGLLIDKCYEAQENIDKNCIRTYKKNTFLESLNSFTVNLLQMGGIYIVLIYMLFNGLSVSDFSSLITATKQFGSNIFDGASVFNRIKTNALYIDYFLELMSYKPLLEGTGTDKFDEDFEMINFKDVCFKYPLSDNFSLENINLKIKKNEKVAIVGLNGAGKTTLIKLMLKFYYPYSGDVLINNRSIKNFKESDIRRRYSIVFQDYRIYGVTIGENILMRKVESKEDETKIWSALEYVGMKDKIMKYPDGLNTVCTREFRSDGAEFSGGEMQRLAIARAFASDADVYILDEPTSNLDPLSERKINNLIIEKSNNKAVLIIAHRLSTVVDANRIILMEYGKIIEEGNHEELMRKRGRYYEMFSAQAMLYKNKDKK